MFGVETNGTVQFKAFSGWETRFGPVLNLAAVIVTPNVMVRLRTILYTWVNKRIYLSVMLARP